MDGDPFEGQQLDVVAGSQGDRDFPCESVEVRGEPVWRELRAPLGTQSIVGAALPSHRDPLVEQVLGLLDCQSAFYVPSPMCGAAARRSRGAAGRTGG